MTSYARALVPRRHRPSVLPSTIAGREGVAIDRDHLARYADVCGFRVGDVLPATYPHVLAFDLAMRLMTGADFPFPAIGLVHVGNTITLRRPIDAGERLDLAVHAAGLRDHPRGRAFDMVTVASSGGSEVWREASTYLRKTRVRTPGGGPPMSPENASTDSEAAKSGPRIPGASFPEPETGPERPAAGDIPARPDGIPATARWQVRAGIGNAYAAVSGDHNPIHTSRVGARAFGFARPIAHGMWTLARCLAALEGRLPDAYSIGVSFKRPVLLPSTVWFGIDGDDFEIASHLAGQVTRP